MKKELLIFGASGALGNGVTEVFLKKNYDKIYLFDFKHKAQYNTKVKQILVKDLSVEENVKIASEFSPLGEMAMKQIELKTLPIVRQGLYFRRWDLGA